MRDISLFTMDQLKLYSVYRSTIGLLFFVEFKIEDGKSNRIPVKTLNNDFCKFISGCNTVWNPTYEQMKILLSLGLKCNEELSIEERELKIENKNSEVVLGTYTFDSSQECTGENKKMYMIVFDNANEEILWIKIKS